MTQQPTPRPAQGALDGKSIHTYTGNDTTTSDQREAAKAMEKMMNATNRVEMTMYYYKYAYHDAQQRLLKKCNELGRYTARVEYLEEKLYRITSRTASPVAAPPRPRQPSRIIYLRPDLSPANGGKNRPGKRISDTKMKIIKQRFKP